MRALRSGLESERVRCVVARGSVVGELPCLAGKGWALKGRDGRGAERAGVGVGKGEVERSSTKCV